MPVLEASFRLRFSASHPHKDCRQQKEYAFIGICVLEHIHIHDEDGLTTSDNLQPSQPFFVSHSSSLSADMLDAVPEITYQIHTGVPLVGCPYNPTRNEKHDKRIRQYHAEYVGARLHVKNLMSRIFTLAAAAISLMTVFMLYLGSSVMA